MAKRGLFISKEDVEKIIESFCEVTNIDIINEQTHQTRYSLSKDDNQFSIDVYYRNDNTCTITSLGNAEKKELGKQLKELIESQVTYNERVSACFTIKIEKKKFQELIDYLEKEDAISKDSDEDKGDNGRIVKLTTNFGDRATLTYYKSSGTMRYQGFMMDLYVGVKTFVTPLGEELSDVEVKKNSSVLKLTSQVEDFIFTYTFEYYNNTNQINKEFIEDSVKMLISNSELNDYAVWTMPILRVLEQRIKEILHFNGIIIDDKVGFKVGNTHIFDCSQEVICVRNSIISQYSLDVETCNCLVSCYGYWKDNRHQLFHSNQVVVATRRVPSPSDAQTIIVEVCKRLEDSYAKIGR